MPITKTINLLPAVFQSGTNQKFLNATLDQLVTEPNLTPINGYVGRKFAPGFKDISTYIRESTPDRAFYQLEPSVVVKDSATDEVTFYTNYPEYLQKISYFGGNVSNPNKLFSSEFYSYDPQINLDAFINFGEYYWLPNGPAAVDVFAGTVDLQKTFFVSLNDVTKTYNFSTYGTVENPDIVLARGGTYQFQINQPGQKFWIQTDPGISGNQINNSNLTSRVILGVENNGEDNGVVSFAVPQKDAQDFFVGMPILQNVDLVSNIPYSSLQGILLSVLKNQYNGIDGQYGGLNGKFVIFGTGSASDADWTANSVAVPANQRTGVWQIQVTPSGNDFLITLNFYAEIPVNNKVLILSGVTNGNTQWYKNIDSELQQIPIITANLDTLYYQNGNSPTGVGVIKLVESQSNTINVETEILGKANYISPNGVTFTNGLKVRFDSSAIPASYQNQEYYVDGVGTSIVLTLVTDLTVNFAQSRANFDPVPEFIAAANASLNYAKDQLTITTTSVPDGVTVARGQFPNQYNPNYIIGQELTFNYPYRGGDNSQGNHESITYLASTIGITAPGILIYGPSSTAYVPGAGGTVWTFDTSFTQINGQDQYGGFPGAAGEYHYTDSKFITANAWGNLSGFEGGSYVHPDGHSKLIGFASDGYPIYGPVGYSNPSDNTSSTVKMKSSYVVSSTAASRPQAQTVTLTANVIGGDLLTVSSTFGLNPGMRITVNNAGIPENSVWVINNGLATAKGIPAFTAGANQVKLSSNITAYAGTTLTFEYLPGSFIEDYSYVPNAGSLDQYNGRFCVTPDFPNGTYAYFATQDSLNNPVYPYFVGRAFYGSVDVDTNTSLTTPDYIVINRSSRDLNPWSRRNRWFHKDVIAASDFYNNKVSNFDQDFRAKRPIIEFKPNLRLFDFGRRGLKPVDIFETTITQPFLTVEGVTGIFLDGVNVVDGMRIIFAADQDPATRGKIWQVEFINQDANTTTAPIIHLVPAEDHDVVADDTVSVFNGISNAGKSFWYNGAVWNEGQAKTGQNQPPLFDVFDKDGVSLSDTQKYPTTNNSFGFNGTRIFGYKEGTGAVDPVLGFPLSYKNFNNIGDIQFENYFDTDTFLYSIDNVDKVDKINTGFLHSYSTNLTTELVNCWQKVTDTTRQYQDISYIYDGIEPLFNIDVTPNPNVTIPNLLVYVNYKPVLSNKYRLYPLPNAGLQIWIDPVLLNKNDRVDILVYSDQVSSIGFFEIPSNLNLNAQNLTSSLITLGDMRNHVSELTQNSLRFAGKFPGTSNLRDINVVEQGGTILQQSAPITFGQMFTNSQDNSLIDSVRYAQQEYSKFKNKFLSIAASTPNVQSLSAPAGVDSILKQINLIKNETFPWYYSDMVPYGDNRTLLRYTVFDPAQRTYELTQIFDNNELSNTAVGVYLNATQLIYGRDYTFLPNGPGVFITANITLNIDDVITIYEYHNTDGCYVPETPSKLGLYPKYIPEIYTDDTYITPQTFIRGHDGSLTPAFNDFRDALILELEKRIFNNIKVSYDEKLVNIYSVKPGKFRNSDYNLQQLNQITARTYLPWIGYNKLNFIDNTSYNIENSFTYNYGAVPDVIDGENLPGSWRACFEYFYDSQHPHVTPWEMLGFSDKPEWWDSTYGPAPYTSGNKILWDDLEAGYVAGGPRQGIDPLFARPGLSKIIPVNENGELKSPLGLLTTAYYQKSFGDSWSVGQYSPVETAWRNSSEYPYAVQIMMAIAKPAMYFAYGIALNKYRYNYDIGQYLVSTTNSRIVSADIDINGYKSLSGTISRSASYLNWVADYKTALGILDRGILQNFARTYQLNLSYRVAGFTSKDRLKVLAEQNSPSSVNESIIVPDSDFDIALNQSAPISNPTYSAVTIEKTAAGWKIGGYDTVNPFFNVIPVTTTGEYTTIKVLNQSVSYYQAFRPVRITVPYGTEFTSLQSVANFITSYERALKVQGFVFDYFDQDLEQIRNWELSIKEFLFWVQQEWAVGSVIVLSPFADRINFTNPRGVIAGIENSFYGTKVLNQNFQILDSDAYEAVRDNNNFKLVLNNKNGNMIAYANLNVVQNEHVVIFKNKTQFNDLIYEPSTGQRQFRLKLIGQRTGNWTGAIAAPGFIYNPPGVPLWQMNRDYLKSDLVEYKNFYYAASKNLPGTAEFNFADWLPVDKNKIKTGLVNNWATNAVQSVDFYDVNSVNYENKFDSYSLGLIGYRNRSYLDSLGLDDTTQAKLYQGFIKEKGTRNAINALGQISFNDQSSSVTIGEDWAFRVGEYGSLETNQFVELVLNEDYTLNNPTSLEVLSNNTVVYSSLYSDREGIYKSATIPFNLPIFLNRNDNSNRSDDIQTAGYVNIEDIDFTIYDIRNIDSLTGNITDIGIGSLIWTAKDFDLNWNVYRVNGTNNVVYKIENSLDNRLVFTTQQPHNLSKNSIVMMPTLGQFSGFYIVDSISSATSFTATYRGPITISNVSIRNPYSSAIYTLVSQRVNSATEILNLTPATGWKVGDKVWVDNLQNDQWAVFNKTEPWSLDSLLNKSVYQANGEFGYTVKLSYDNNFALTGQPGLESNTGIATNYGGITNYLIGFDNKYVEDLTVTSTAANTSALGFSLDSGKNYNVAGAPKSANNKGYVFIYERSFQGSINQTQILAPNTANAAAFGTDVAISSDDQWIYVGAPGEDSVYVYGFYNSAAEESSTIVSNGSQTTFTLDFTPYSTELVSVKGTGKDYVPFVEYTIVGSDIIFNSPPVADSIVIRQNPGYIFVDKITYANAGSNFGFSLSCTTDGAQIVVGAPTANVTVGNTSIVSAGTISAYDRSIEKFVALENQTLFGGVRPVTVLSKVYSNETLQTLGTDYVVVAGNWVQFIQPQTAGSIVTIETNVINFVQEHTASNPTANSLFGYDVDICNYNCSIYAGSPYYNNGTVFQSGLVYRFLNQSRVYGTIKGTIQNPVVTSGDSIRLNDYEVSLIQPTLDGVVSAINDAPVPGVTAQNVNGYLVITADSQLIANKLTVLPGIGTAITDLGLDIFPQTQIIDNPTNYPYDKFGHTVQVSSNSEQLFVGSPDATTISDTTFDKYSTLLTTSQAVFGTKYVTDANGKKSRKSTTYDADSTRFKDAIISGAVWTFGILPSNVNNISSPGQFAYVQQLTPSNQNLAFTPNLRFGHSVDSNQNLLLAGAPGGSTVAPSAGAVYLFADDTRLNGWDALRSQEPTVDINSIIKVYSYSATNQSIIDNFDYIDPAKGKILGLAEQEITYKTDYDPAVYNNVTNAELGNNSTFYWNNTQIGQVWWDLSAVKYLDYEQGSVKYRTVNWGREFPGSSIDVYEWVESLYPPNQYVARGGVGVPKYADNSAYVTVNYVDPITNQSVVRYYFWVKDKTTVDVIRKGRTLPVSTIADYIRAPKATGIKYIAAIRDDSVAVYNMVGDTTGRDTILHVDYATKINSNIIHSEYALLNENEIKPEAIPQNIYSKLLDSVSGLDKQGNPVPDPKLPVQSRYGIGIRPRQSMFIDRNKAVEEMVSYVNDVFAKNIISQGFDLTTLNSSEPVPPANPENYNITVNNIEELSYINIIIQPVGYKVLVLNDSTVSNLWTIYTKQANNTWKLIRVQSYRTSDYWQYVDWYAESYDRSKIPTYTVNTISDMSRIRYRAGDVVKVLNNGQGKWVLLQIYSNTTLTVGIQNGTIQLTENLYNLAKFGMGFGNDNFDTRRFDQNPSIEIRKILEALKNNLFINQLSRDFIQLFFVFVYYVLNEQKYIDWAFKTSFITALQKLKALDQPQISNKDNQTSYQQYIEEVKPYHTTIREYVVDYQGNDNFNGYVTDFDVPATFDSTLNLYRSPSGEYAQDITSLQDIQYRDWLTNYSYTVGEIEVVNGGSGYTVPPQVTITGSQIGNDAVARALISNGIVSKIQVLYGGSNYLTQPTITLTGGNGSGAVAYAILKNEVVRKIKTTLVYDRITYGSQVVEWTPNTAYSQGTIIAYNNVAYVVDRNFTSGATFVGNDLSIYPATNFENANDRIQSYYAPGIGLPGKNFALLQTGIDYPGVQVEGPLYTDSGGFDVSGFDSAPFDPIQIDADGTFVISDSLLDTKISSSYTDLSLGTRPEDIIVDGGAYVDTYSSHAPEELVPGRVYDTLDMTVYTFATDATSSEYNNWLSSTAFSVGEIVLLDGGSGYSANSVSVTISGTTGSGASAIAQVDNVTGAITGFNIINSGAFFTTIPDIIITGANTSPARAAVRLVQNTYSTFEYRYFKDMNDNVSYYVAAPSSSTVLASNLTITANTITVANSAVLSEPDPVGGIPGVIFVNGERITYWTKDDNTNTLGQIRRGTAGTGANVHLVNSIVVSASAQQVVPYSENTIWTTNVDVLAETTSTLVYNFKANTPYIRSKLWYTTGLSGVPLVTEFEANVEANVITTESSIAIETDSNNFSTQTDGRGLYNSTTIQALFVKSS